jgi:hypothetical protein
MSDDTTTGNGEDDEIPEDPDMPDDEAVDE